MKRLFKNRVRKFGIVLATAGGLAPAVSWAGFNIAADAFGSGTEINSMYDSGDDSTRRYQVYTAGGFSNYQTGPNGTPEGSKGYGLALSSRGEVGSGYIRARTRTEITAGDLPFPSSPLAVSRLAASAIHNDVVFGGTRTPGTTIPTKLRVKFSGTDVSNMQVYNRIPLDGFNDNAYGSVSLSIGLLDLDEPDSTGYVFQGGWTWAFDQPGGVGEFKQVGAGYGLLDNWGVGGFREFSLPVDVVVGHRYQFALDLTVMSRVETNGNMTGFSEGDFGHTLALADVPFDLPADVTVNSAEAKIFNGVFAGAPAVPEPAALGLLAVLPMVVARRRA